MDPLRNFSAIPLSIGNAVKLSFIPPSDDEWAGTRILRKAGTISVPAVISGPTDAAATIIWDQSGETTNQSLDEARWMLDIQGLVNGILYTYAAYAYDAVPNYSDVLTITVTPAVTYTYQSFELKDLFLDRLPVTMADELLRGMIRLKSGVTKIPVISASPAPGSEDTWPVVSVHLDSDAMNTEAIGHETGGQTFNEGTNLWVTNEGAYFAQAVSVLAWTLNPEERDEMRRALKRQITVVMHELVELGQAAQLGLNLQDAEEFSLYPAPVYFAICHVTCLALAQWFETSPPIREVDVTETVTEVQI
jgi:hypothetical protein